RARRPQASRRPQTLGGARPDLGGWEDAEVGWSTASAERDLDPPGEERVVQREGRGHGVRGDVEHDGPLDAVARVDVGEERVRVTEVDRGARVGGVLAASGVDELLAA